MNFAQLVMSLIITITNAKKNSFSGYLTGSLILNFSGAMLLQYFCLNDVCYDFTIEPKDYNFLLDINLNSKIMWVRWNLG